MAERINRFKQKYESRTKTATDDIVEQLYKSEEKEEKTVEEKKPEPVKMPEPVIPAPVIQETPAKEEPVVVKEKKKVGRPRKTGEERTIFNVKLSLSEREMLDVAASACGKTKVDYLLGLVNADYELNKEYYEAVKEKIMANK